MALVYVEGVDGTGKTTLIHHLIQSHPAGVAVTAPPLWTYLPAVDVPEAFPAWVTATPATTIAADLLSAQRTRIGDLLTLTRQHTIVLVDRGPQTVEASTRAHLATGPPSPSTPPTAIARLTAELHAAVRHLAEAHPCLSIELTAASYDEIIDRLTGTERNNATYLRYLHTFLHEFQVSATDNTHARLALASTAPIARNTAAARQAVQALI